MIDVKFEFNGKPFNPRDFEDALVKAAMESIADQMRQRIGSIRHPETGEFPTIVVSGKSLEDMQARVEGSPELLAIIAQKMNKNNLEESVDGSGITMSDAAVPKVFFSYAWEDRELASTIAKQLQANGIDTWWAEWCISAGESLRQRIDEGLASCTHFIVLLTESSLSKPWVNQEMDAGLMLKLESQAKFIAVRHKLAAERLPPLLRGMLSPSVDDPDHDVAQLINDIHGVSRKPTLGRPPDVVTEAKTLATGYSAAATAVAKVFVLATRHALKMDPQVRIDRLMSETGLSKEDIVDALHELGSLAIIRPDVAWPDDELFAIFDRYWMAWDPSEDALTLARDMLSVENFPHAPGEIAERYGWAPRRLNPALAYLNNRRLVRALKAMSGGPWVAVSVTKTDETRRFAKSRN